nr:MAG TPA: hypothetical protein [Caudoviricetes sp.]
MSMFFIFNNTINFDIQMSGKIWVSLLYTTYDFINCRQFL